MLVSQLPLFEMDCPMKNRRKLRLPSDWKVSTLSPLPPSCFTRSPSPLRPPVVLLPSLRLADVNHGLAQQLHVRPNTQSGLTRRREAALDPLRRTVGECNGDV